MRANSVASKSLSFLTAAVITSCVYHFDFLSNSALPFLFLFIYHERNLQKQVNELSNRVELLNDQLGFLINETSDDPFAYEELADKHLVDINEKEPSSIQ